MISEEEIILAFLFKRSGKSKQSFSDLYLTLSMDLNWFTPEAAKEFINLELKKKLLIKKADLIEPNFDFRKIVIPVGFYPVKKKYDEEMIVDKESDVFVKIVNEIVKKTDIDEKEIIHNIEEIEKEKNINLEVAALLVGKDYNLVLEDFFEEIENNIFTQNTE